MILDILTNFLVQKLDLFVVFQEQVFQMWLIFSIGMQPVCCLVKRDDHEESVFMRKVRVCSSNNVVRGCSA